MTERAERQVHVSAPGKLMLLGEHAVVHARPCLVTAVEARLFMSLALDAHDSRTLTIHAPDVGVEHVTRPLPEVFADGTALAPGTRFIESAVRLFRERHPFVRGVRIATRADFSSRLGLGSSSATVACTLFGLAHLFDVALTRREIFELGLEAIFRVQQTGSGFDLASAIYGGTLYYHSAEPRTIEPIPVRDLPLVVAYTGVKADTPTYVRQVGQRLAHWPQAVNDIFDLMARLVEAGKEALLHEDWPRLGELFDMQHGLAHALGIDTPETAQLVFAARAAGAYGAKLSGAGGGDCIIVLAPDEQRAAIGDALEAAGGEVVDAAPQAAGVRLEREEDTT